MEKENQLLRRSSSINRIREFPLPEVNLTDEYEIIHTLFGGFSTNLYLVEHLRTRSEVVLKALCKHKVSKSEFYREFHYSYYLSPHGNILSTYDVAFQNDQCYLFAQEYAPFGDLTSYLSEQSLGEMETKLVIRQVISALDFMHSKDLVHGDLRPEKILVFESDFSRVKLCDFGTTRRRGDLVKKKNAWLPCASPEICETPLNESYGMEPSQDVWGLAMMIYVLLTGSLPWQRAESSDPHFYQFNQWHKRKLQKIPNRFSHFSPKLIRMMRRILDPDPEKRIQVTHVSKYLNYRWLLKTFGKPGTCKRPVSYYENSVISCEDKNTLLKQLLFNSDVSLDKRIKCDRVYEWIQSIDRHFL